MLKQDSIKLLYIEDDDLNSRLILDLLTKSVHTKFEPIHKETLKGGLKYLRETDCDVDVILLDLMLPNSHGVDTYLSVSKECGNTPIVIISGHEDIACECVKLGAQDYLLKTGLSSGILIRSLKYAIERSKLENMYEDIIQKSSLGYHMYELKKGKLIFVGYNKTADKILNIDNSKFLNKEIKEAFPHLPDYVIEGYKIALEQNIPFKDQIVEYQDENISYATFGVNAYKTSANQLVVTFSDITERLKEQQALKISEQKFRNLVEVTKAGMYEIDFINSKFVYVNDVVCEQLGYKKEELLELNPFDILTEESMNKFSNRLAALARGEHIEAIAEYQVIRKDGSIAWVLIAPEFIEDENKNITGANVVAIDITDRKIAESIIKDREKAVYEQLENKINEWRTEIIQTKIRREQQLSLIQGEILSLNENSHEVSYDER